jgi:protein-tyrosine phosphatase
MDALWKPTWPAEIIEWVDRGLPSDPERAAAQITEAFARARAGERVEIGCLGGRGRTGTVLAAMAVLAGVPPTEAVRWVREHYDVEAVETREQAKWVLWFASEARSGPAFRRATQASET